MTTIFIMPNADRSHSVKLQSDDPTAFKLAIETLKSFVNPQLRSYDPSTKHWNIAEPATYQLRRWTNYCRVNIHAEVKWLDAEDYDEEEEESAPPPRQPKRPQKAEAYAALHLLPSAPPELIKAAYRALSRLNHPDHGGDTVAMQKINKAYEVLAA